MSETPNSKDRRIAPQSPRGQEQPPAAAGKKRRAAITAAAVAAVCLVAAACCLGLGVLRGTDTGSPAPTSGQESAAARQEGDGDGSSNAAADSPSSDGEGSPENTGSKQKKEAGTSKSNSSSNDSSAKGGSSQGSKTKAKSADVKKSSASKESASSSKSSKSSSGKSSSSASGKSSDANAITVTFSIDGSRAGNQDSASMGACSLSLRKGATVYDALVASGVSIAGDATYVSSINGLAERQCGALSGWMYHVNGAEPQVSCGKYTLKDGDKVQWLYTCDMGNDL